jgi:hypothetical protein
MVGRLTKSLACIAVITAMSPVRGPAPDLAAIAGDVGQSAAAQAQALCLADTARCLRLISAFSGDQAASPAKEARPAQDTLTETDRAAPPRRR